MKLFVALIGTVCASIYADDRLPCTDPVPLGMCDIKVKYSQILAKDDVVFGVHDLWMEIIDVSDPTNPILIGKHVPPHRSYGLDLVGDIAYLAVGYEGLDIVDVSDPASPELISYIDTRANAKDVEVVDGIAYVADTATIHVINVQDPKNPTLISRFDMPQGAASIVVQDGVAYVANRRAGLILVDVSDPKNLSYISKFETTTDALYVLLSGQTVFLLVAHDGVMTIDVSDPLSPVLLDTYSFQSSVISDIAIEGTKLLLADDSHGMLVSDPARIELMGMHEVWSGARSVGAKGNLAFFADYNMRFQVSEINLDCNGCAADANHDGTHDIFDVFLFLEYFSDELPWADYTNDGIFDVFDIFAFLDAYEDGCP